MEERGGKEGGGVTAPYTRPSPLTLPYAGDNATVAGTADASASVATATLDMETAMGEGFYTIREYDTS